MLQSPNLVSNGGAGQGEEEHLLPHFGHTACSVALSIGNCCTTDRDAPEVRSMRRLGGFAGVENTDAMQ